MKKKLILKQIINNHKILLIILMIGTIIIGSLLLKRSYALRPSQLNINGDSGVDVGDVVSLRKYIIDSLGKHTVKINAINGYVFNSTNYLKNTELVSANTILHFNITPKENYYYIKSFCNNNYAGTYLVNTGREDQENSFILDSPINSDVECTIIFGTSNTTIIEDHNSGIQRMFQNVLTNKVASSSISLTGYYDKIIKEYYLGQDSNCNGTYTAANKATISVSVSENGTYYLCTKDQNDLLGYVSFKIDNFDKEAPIITNVTNNKQSCESYFQVHLNVEDLQTGVSAYAISTTDDSSALTWTTIAGSPNSYDFTVKLGSLGYYYFWFKDQIGNVSSIPILVSSLCGTITDSFPIYFDQQSKYTYENQTFEYMSRDDIISVEKLVVDNGTATYKLLDSNTIEINLSGGTPVTSTRPYRVTEFSDFETNTPAELVTINNNGTLTEEYVCNSGTLTEENMCITCKDGFLYDSIIATKQCSKTWTSFSSYHYIVTNLTYKFKTTYEQ